MSSSSSSSESKDKNQSPDIELNNFEISLVRWEEICLALEEHFHANEMYNRSPNGPPMGHR